ncbi:universal stress protein [Thermodesulfovibrio sp. Kuro-1]|uniref:universal stress protein n=1 Tax=Thermodesulfovibrio sp. Kuro-1 TaxID=2580394 RepID=UPI001143ACC4|nr:universal stress protein [Thermodesulfovibrio sp. Kuro-1]
MYEKILYPIKFEEFSMDILKCMLNFKKVGTKEIILIHVVDVSKLPMEKYAGYDLDFVKTLTEIADKKMEKALKLISEAGLSSKKFISTGVPYREILKVAEQESVSFIISGRQRKSLLGEIFIGSNTDKIIRYGRFPVYVPKYPACFGDDFSACERYCENPFKKILYPTDWSDCAESAIKYILRLKNSVEEIVIAHIMDEKSMKLQPLEKFREFERINMEKLESLKLKLEQEGFKVKTHLSVGKPSAEIINLAKQEDITCIAMGVHGKGFIEGILWGSVSRNVVEYSDSPVLVTKGGVC